MFELILEILNSFLTTTVVGLDIPDNSLHMEFVLDGFLRCIFGAIYSDAKRLRSEKYSVE